MRSHSLLDVPARSEIMTNGDHEEQIVVTVTTLKKSAMTTRACGRRTGLMESLAIGIRGYPPNTHMDPNPADEISPHPTAFGSCIPHHKTATPKVGRLLDTVQVRIAHPIIGCALTGFSSSQHVSVASVDTPECVCISRVNVSPWS